MKNKGYRLLCGVLLGLAAFTVNTLAGASQRSHMSVCVWAWGLLSQCFYRVGLHLVMKDVKRRKKDTLLRKLREGLASGLFLML